MPTVSSTEFHFERNNTKHRTDEISIKRLILRRGQEFQVTVNFGQNGFNNEAGQIVLIAETGPQPSHSAGTQIFIPLSNMLDPTTWSAVMQGSSQCALSLTINSSPNAKIGRYALKLHDTTEEQSYLLGEFVLLFNPWCSEDEVFLDNAEQREEYVMNETGMIYINTYNNIQPVIWDFGQFEEDVVDICLKLLDQNPKCLRNVTKDYIRRNDPIYISRVVSAMVNSCDDKGVLVGRWSEPYYPYTRPTAWIGSVEILRKWCKSNCQPVYYGQCWVFGAVACTVLRCLGIPTRVVTNFQSAHDTNGNLTIDIELDQYGRSKRDKKDKKDSIWNFHVWIESWMTRTDLKLGFDGWQVLDPTPQEKSEGVHCCGPVPVKAIKEGQLNVKFDAPFVYAEVNADVVTWICFNDGSKKKYSVNSTQVGRNISTKAIGSIKREDITENYKYPEGSTKERRVSRIADLKNKYDVPKEVGFGLSVKTQGSISFGKDVEAHVYFYNKSDKNIVCNLDFCAEITSYTGKVIREVMIKNINNIFVGAHADMTVPIVLTYADYGGFLANYGMIKLTAVGTEIYTNETTVATEFIGMVYPFIDIKFLDQPVQYRKVQVEIRIENPLPVPLKECVLTFEGAGLVDNYQMRIDEIIRHHATIVIVITPWKSGLRTLVVELDCDKIKDVKGFQTKLIQKA